MLIRVACLSFAAVLVGCASSERSVAPAGDRAGPAIVLTANNMNAHSSSVPILNQKMATEVQSVALLVQQKLEKSGRKVIRKDFAEASPQDVSRIISEEKNKPTDVMQIFWSANDKGHVFLNIVALPITYGVGGMRFGNDSGKKVEVLGPGTYSTITAEEIAEAFVRSQQE